MNFLGIGFMLGTMIASTSQKNDSYSRPIIVNDNVEYSCNWWREQINPSITKPKMAILLTKEVRESRLLTKRVNFEGLTIFVPKNKKGLEKVIEKYRTQGE